eukprot:SAG11_NODE_1420_length_4956_cov_5.104797_2_plen_61_part_00
MLNVLLLESMSNIGEQGMFGVEEVDGPMPLALWLQAPIVVRLCRSEQRNEAGRRSDHLTG